MCVWEGGVPLFLYCYKLLQLCKCDSGLIEAVVRHSCVMVYCYMLLSEPDDTGVTFTVQRDVTCCDLHRFNCRISQQEAV